MIKRLLILHTGGTIAMSQHEDGSVATTSDNPLLHLSFEGAQDLDIVSESIFNLPSPHITLHHMLQLKQRIQQAYKEGFEAIVITHGTDTLEETAYFLDITLQHTIPIVITGAMRSSNAIGSDGVYNLQQAIRVAISEQSIGNGVLVVMNDEIHAARFVTKTHTTNVATFRTPTFGPIGLIEKNGPHFFQNITCQPTLDITHIDGTVPIVKAYAGMGAQLFDMIADHASKIDGLVIEALGAGNMPPTTLPALQHILNQHLPIVLVSRCVNGMAEPVYDYQGGGRQLQDMGILFAKGLNSQKARIRLLVALNAHLDHQTLCDFMTN